MSDAVLDAIVAAAPGAVVEGDVVVLGPDLLVAAAEASKAQGFEMCVDLTAVDYLDRTPRFEVVVSLLSQQLRRRVRLRCQVPAADPTVPSLTSVYPSVNFYEREVYDLMGITFAGHPDMTRIMMPDDWEGHPLRKDYPVGSVPVQFKSSPSL
jgi:NADH-quinone oxidoreductase subunit C